MRINKKKKKNELHFIRPYWYIAADFFNIGVGCKKIVMIVFSFSSIIIKNNIIYLTTFNVSRQKKTKPC